MTPFITCCARSGHATKPSLGVSGLRVEYPTDPVGIDATHPRISRRIVSGERNTVQAAYQIQVTRSERLTLGLRTQPG